MSNSSVESFHQQIPRFCLRGRIFEDQVGFFRLVNQQGQWSFVFPGSKEQQKFQHLDLVEIILHEDPFSLPKKGKGPEFFLDLSKVAEPTISILVAFQGDADDLSFIGLYSERRKKGVAIRHKVCRLIGEFFENQGFLETPTPILVPCPGMETHIRPFEVQRSKKGQKRLFLPTSPEFSMKKLLVAGLEKIYQMAPAFRDEPLSPIHDVQFTMLEWYRAFEDEKKIQQDCEQLFEWITTSLFRKPEIFYQGKVISCAAPWPRLSIRQLFLEHCHVDLGSADREELFKKCEQLGLNGKSSSFESWDDFFFKLWLNCIEPKLPAHQAVFVERFPASQAALAKLDQDPDGSFWARRFEVYMGGMELGNAFFELTDPKEQEQRFIKDMDLREKIYGPDFSATPIDQEFLKALREGMPPSAGIAMGVDRIIQLCADEKDLCYTKWFDKPSF